MNDQAKKLRELAQKIREERDRASLIVNPITSSPETILPIIEDTTMHGATAYAPAPAAVRSNTTNGAIEVIKGAEESETIRTRRSMPAKLISTAPSPIAKGTRLIAVSSGKGGVGKSNLTANLGIALAMRGRKVMLLDADLGLANIDVLFGINPKYNLQHLIDGEKTLEEILVVGPHNMKIIPGGSGIPELANLGDGQQQMLIESFTKLDREADITLIDTGAGISKNVISFILAAREAIIVTTPEPTAITDAYGLIKVLTQRDAEVDIRIVVNMVSSEAEGRDIADRIVMATKQFLHKRIEILGYIIADPSVNMSVRKQEPFILKYPGARASKCVKQIAMAIDTTSQGSAQVASRHGFKGFLSRLLER